MNLRSGEAVLFKVGDRSFVRTFEPTVDHPTFELSDIAPAGIDVSGVQVYCEPTPYERVG